MYIIAEQQILSILQERCDGNRNILHACVHMCAPTSNKEPDIGEKNIAYSFMLSVKRPLYLL